VIPPVIERLDSAGSRNPTREFSVRLESGAEAHDNGWRALCSNKAGVMLVVAIRLEHHGSLVEANFHRLVSYIRIAEHCIYEHCSFENLLKRLSALQ
jgi:hypothetical protein